VSDPVEKVKKPYKKRPPKTRKATELSDTALAGLPKKFIHLPSYRKHAAALLPVVQNLAAQGFTEGEIGMVLGSVNKTDTKIMVRNLREDLPEFEKAWRNGVRTADVQLIQKAWQLAMGFQYDETTIEESSVNQQTTDDEGNTSWESKPVLKRKTIRKYREPSETMLLFLIQNRLKEEFKNVQRVEVDKKSVNVTAELTQKQMQEISGKLIEHLQNAPKQIPCIEVEHVKPSETTINPRGVFGLDPTGQAGEPPVESETTRVSGEGSVGPEDVPGILSTDSPDNVR
jgi:hypothetical protein